MRTGLIKILKIGINHTFTLMLQTWYIHIAVLVEISKKIRFYAMTQHEPASSGFGKALLRHSIAAGSFNVSQTCSCLM